nr:hypothetical protein [uncultured Brevundimonas sp.]
MFVSLVIVSSLLVSQEAAASTSSASSPSQPAVSAQTAISPATRTPSPTAAPQRRQMVCETRALTGRRIERRVCYTPEQYAEMIEVKRKQAEEIVASGHVQNDIDALGGPGPI